MNKKPLKKYEKKKEEHEKQNVRNDSGLKRPAPP